MKEKDDQSHEKWYNHIHIDIRVSTNKNNYL